MRQEVQVYVTIKLKGLNQRFEESDGGNRQMGFLFIVVITINDKISTLSDMSPATSDCLESYFSGPFSFLFQLLRCVLTFLGPFFFFFSQCVPF